MYKLILKHVESSTPLALQQWGFRSGRSTVSALIDVTHNWLQTLDTGKEICAVFFDLHKAFNSIPHRSLVYKLQSLGIDCYILKWLFSYLHNREQYNVVLNGKRSPPNRITSGRSWVLS